MGLLKRTLRIRTHHLVKTFWGWRDQQLPDGTVILTSPAGRTYVTTPGSALLFPSLCLSTGGMPAPEADPPEYCGDRSAMMPKRRRTRAQDRAHRIASERKRAAVELRILRARGRRSGSQCAILCDQQATDYP